MSEKVVVLNGKRFIVGNSKIRPTKCHIDNKRKKILSKEEIKRERMVKKRKDKIELMSMPNRRKTKRSSRKMRESKEKIE